jgi:hypothetical protein
LFKRREVTGVWIKSRNEELHNLYSSPCRSCVEMIKEGWDTRSMGRTILAYRVLVENNPKVHRPLIKLRCRCEDNIKMDPKEINLELVDGFMQLKIETCCRILC